MAELPKFDAPPVVEAVLGLQFKAVPNLSAAHIGAFWNTQLRDFPRVEHAHRLDDVFEQFTGERQFKQPGINLSDASTFPRLQFVSDDEERMIQIQDTRFIFNWRKRVGDYPSFSELSSHFDSRFRQFADYVRSTGSGELALNQWEMTYVDHIPAGTLWQSPSDWKSIVPSIDSPTGCKDQVLDTFRCHWALDLSGACQGKLHIEIRHAKLLAMTGPELLVINTTARGPIPESLKGDYRPCFDFAHQHLVRAFDGMTSERAHEFWKRRA
jgi:uncharacterized protein (TIGR04255 family)